MQHCGGGPGPTSFGNNELFGRDDASNDADHDVFAALDRWVTQGVAPDKIIGTGTIGVRSEYR
jgi:feruloyl esterase